MPAGKSNLTYAARALQYAEDVVNEKIPACKWVRLACERQIADLERWSGKDQPYRFDEEKANHVCQFIELLPHIKGEWAKRGEKLKLENWQCFILCTVFGWYTAAGYRRFRTAYTEVPRKNAKSTLSSGVGLYMVGPDGEAGAEVYSAATTRDQAKIIFADSQAMARREAGFRKRFGVAVNAHNISVLSTGSKFEALSAEGSSLDGLNIHCGLVDELHAHKTRAVFDVLETATGSRRQSLIWLITTAGSNRAGVCYEQRDYVIKVLQRTAVDETYFGIIYTIDEGDDWTSEAAWAKANPNYGISVLKDDIARLCAKAMETPSAQSNFLTKRLNVWVTSDTPWMPMDLWDKAGDPKLDIADFAGCECYMGIDLATVSDIAAVAKLFRKDGISYLFVDCYLPEDTVQNSSNSQYSGWESTGRIISTDGGSTDFDRIAEDVLDACKKYNVKHIGKDPFQSHQFGQQLEKAGVSPGVLIDYGATVQNFSEPMKDILAMVINGTLKHDANPVLAWMMSNVVAHMDAKENIFPRKERPENKIDGVVGAIMANGIRMRFAPVSSAWANGPVVI